MNTCRNSVKDILYSRYTLSALTTCGLYTLVGPTYGERSIACSGYIIYILQKFSSSLKEAYLDSSNPKRPKTGFSRTDSRSIFWNSAPFPHLLLPLIKYGKRLVDWVRVQNWLTKTGCYLTYFNDPYPVFDRSY